MVKNLKYLRYIFLAIILGVITFKGIPDGTPKEDKESTSYTINPLWDEAVKYAKENLPTDGQLVLKSDGYVYLKVDDGYVHTLFPMLGLKEIGYIEPPYFRNKEAPGAHISVFYENEHIKPKEVGQYFHFTLKDIKVINLVDGISYAILEVESPELEKLREKYGLAPKLLGHNFHISLAKKTIHGLSK